MDSTISTVLWFSTQRNINDTYLLLKMLSFLTKQITQKDLIRDVEMDVDSIKCCEATSQLRLIPIWQKNYLCSFIICVALRGWK